MSRPRALTDAQVAEIRARYALGRTSQRELAKYYDVTQTTITRVVRGAVSYGVDGRVLPLRGARA